jgi:hypothetical protein
MDAITQAQQYVHATVELFATTLEQLNASKPLAADEDPHAYAASPQGGGVVSAALGAVQTRVADADALFASLPPQLATERAQLETIQRLVQRNVVAKERLRAAEAEARGARKRLANTIAVVADAALDERRL